MKSSTQDKVEGTAREISGKIKQTAGEATKNPQLRDRGQGEKIGGKIQRKVGEAKKELGF